MNRLVGYRGVLVVLILAVLALSSCTRETSWRQRLTISIETPAGDVRGSSVTEVHVVDHYGSLIPRDATGPRATVRGEAVAIEVLPGKWLFALLDGGETVLGSAIGWSDAAYGLTYKPDGQQRDFYERAWERDSQPMDTPVPLPPEAWPMLVTFEDITKPETVRRVNPEDLAAVFGEGVRLKAVMLEVTEEAVTEGRVEGVLGWWCANRTAGSLNDDPEYFGVNALFRNVSPADFRIGECK